MEQDEMDRIQAKTAEQRFLNVMTQEYNHAPRVAQAVYEEAKACLLGQPQNLRPGQIRKILVKRDAVHGQSLQDSEMIEVTWTIDAGQEDDEIKKREGVAGLRRERIQRLLEEALSQGAVASQEDLGRVLHVCVRTIKRDCEKLEEQGISLPTRGNLQGIGAGQSHKAKIVGRWLRGETYDQIAQRTRHSLFCINRYVEAFARVINLKQKEMANGEICLLLQMSCHLLDDYLAIYTQNDTPFCRQRLQEEIERLTQANNTQKKRRDL